jgi:adenine deaminase
VSDRPPVDLVLRNGRVLDVFSGRFREADLAVSGGRIVGFGSADAAETRDVDGAWVIPGLIDAHVHIESSQLTPGAFARAIVPRGTTTVIADPHEIANVLGTKGIRYMLDVSESIPLGVFFMAPSCVPSCPFESPGAVLGPDEISELLTWDRVLGLGEVMNYPGVIGRDPDVLAKIAAAHGRPIDGHGPGLTGPDLWAYAAAGPGTDHECTTADEAREKLATGLRVLIREGTTARNLDALLPILDERSAPFVHFCTDDRHPESLLDEGHLDDLLRRAIAYGVPPEIAIASATVHPACTYGLADRGALAPGRRADFVVLSDLSSFSVCEVYVGGRLVAAEGAPRFEVPASGDERARGTVRIDPEAISFRIPYEGASRASVRVIEVEGTQVLTGSGEGSIPVVEGALVANPGADLLKLAVIERHTGSQRVGMAFARGFGLARGALASSVAHDAHNVIVVGASDEEMRFAVAELTRLGGGQVVVEGGRVLAALPLPIAGLMRDGELVETAEMARSLTDAARRLGCRLPAPFATLSFLALPVIPHLKLTDRGVVDVDRFEIVPLVLGEA